MLGGHPNWSKALPDLSDRASYHLQLARIPIWLDLKPHSTGLCTLLGLIAGSEPLPAGFEGPPSAGTQTRWLALYFLQLAYRPDLTCWPPDLTC